MPYPDFSDQVYALHGLCRRLQLDGWLDGFSKPGLELELVWVLPRTTMTEVPRYGNPQLDALFGTPIIEIGGPGVDRPYLAIRPKQAVDGLHIIKQPMSQVLRDYDRAADPFYESF